MNNLVIIKVIYRIFFLGLFFVFLTNSCSTSSDIPCPDFRNNKNYSKKYQSGYRLNRKYSKNQSLRYEISEFHLPYFLWNSKTNNVDFTINPEPLLDSVVLKINTFLPITPIQIHSINK